MKNLFLVLCSVFFLSSCFEIIEEIDLNSDGSGALTYTLNLSQSKTKINSIMLLDSLNGHKIPDKSLIRSKISEVLVKIKSAEGLSNVKSSQDFDNYIFTFSCNFKDAEALNKASEYIKESYNIKDPNLNSSDHFSYNTSSKTFRRKGDYKGKAEPKEMQGEEFAGLDNAEFTAIYRFDQEVKSASNSNAKISPNNKAVMLKYKAMEVATGKKSIENTITFK